jgi:hypothetical protein
VQNNLKVSSQCVKVTKTANKVLGMIKRSFISRNKDIVLTLYKSLVRPHLEYCVQAWRPHFVKDIALIEGVQKRATYMISGLHDVSYENRLRNLKLTTLETRRLRGDLIEVFKIVKGFVNVPADFFFTFNNNRTRGHMYKLHKKRFNTDIGKYVFSNRVVDVWNRLPNAVVSCITVTSFKCMLDHVLQQDWGLI